jgi:Tfp pilus assembly protein PilW
MKLDRSSSRSPLRIGYCRHRLFQGQRRRIGGGSLVEVMIALTITAMLLTAVAAAFSASASAIEHNDRFFRATQAARVAMNQILDAVRRSHAVQLTTDPSPPSIVNSTWVEALTFDGHDYTYSFGGSQLRLTDNGATGSPQFTLARNVTSAQFIGEYAPNPNTGALRCVKVTLDIVVEIGGNRVHLSGSAVPRRTITY